MGDFPLPPGYAHVVRGETLNTEFFIIRKEYSSFYELFHKIVMEQEETNFILRSRRCVCDLGRLIKYPRRGLLNSDVKVSPEVRARRSLLG